MSRWRDFLRGVAGSAHGRLLLKSPAHTFRLPLMQSIFPRAQFIWIGRHPGEVLASNDRMWRSMMSTYALWDCPQGELESFLRDVVRASSLILESCVAEMPPDRMLWIDYAELTADPTTVLRQILRFVGAPAASDRTALKSIVESAVATVPIHAGRRAELPNEESLLALDRLMRAARGRLGAAYRD